MTRHTLLVAVLALLAPCPVLAQFPTTAVDSLFGGVIGPNDPGCSVVVTQNGAIVFERGYGLANLESGERLSPATILGIGSMSKQFTGAAVAALIRRGSLAPGTDVTRYLPELPQYGGITIGDLVHHTSGLRDYTSLWSRAGFDPEGGMSRADALGILARQQGLTAPVGTQQLYSNSNYFLLSLIVERVSGQPFPRAVETLVFQPLGMTSARFLDGPGAVVPGRAPSYRQAAMAGGSPQTVMLGNPLWGDGGMYASARDLVRWELNFVSPKLEGGQPFLDLILSWGRLRSGDSVPHAFGLQHLSYRGQPTIEHGGTWGGYRSYFLRLVQPRAAVIVLCNRFELSPFVLSHRVADLAFPDVFPRPAPVLTGPSPATEVPAKPIERRDDYVGEYHSPELDLSLRVERDEAGGLTVSKRMAAPEPLRRIGGDTLEDLSTRWVFDRDESGSVTGFTFVGGRVNGVRFHRVPAPKVRIRKGRAIVVDGVLAPNEWSDADSLSFRSAGRDVVVRVKHDGSSLLFAFTGLGMDNPLRVGEVLIDATGTRPRAWTPQQFWIHVSARDCWASGRYNDYSTCRGEGDLIEANNIRGAVFPSVYEIRVPVSMIGGALTPGRRLGFAFDATDTRAVWDFWPAGARLDTPASWALAEIMP